MELSHGQRRAFLAQEVKVYQQMAVLMDSLSIGKIFTALGFSGSEALTILLFAFDAVPYNKLFQMLEVSQSSRLQTTVKGYGSFSCLDTLSCTRTSRKTTLNNVVCHCAGIVVRFFHPVIDTHRGKGGIAGGV
jgi:hypothetical protein